MSIQIDVYRTVCCTIDSLRRGRIHPARGTMFFRSTFVEPRRGDYQSPVALPSNSTNHRYYGTNLQLCSTAWGVPFLLRQERDQSPPKKGDLGEALRLCCGNASTFRHYPRQPKFALPQDPLPRCAKLLHDTNRFLNNSTNSRLMAYIFQIRAEGTPRFFVLSS